MTEEEAVKMISKFEYEICNRQLELNKSSLGGPGFHMVAFHEHNKKVQIMKRDIIQAMVDKEK